jgi:DNA-binding NarL/FixJ family response regulator
MPENSGMTENPEPVTVVVADDQSAVRQGLVLLLGTVPGITVTGEAEDGEAAVEMVAAKNPQVVLMDLNMPRCDGVEATRRIRASHPQTQVVVLTTYSDDESIIGALQAGALGYLTKDATRAEIGRAVLAAAAGQAVLDPEVQQRLLSAAVRAPAAPSATGAADPADTDLTPRESEVLRLIAAGKSNREIARALFVSEATVKTHVNRIFAKTGSRDRTQAMRYAYTHGYADPRLPSQRVFAVHLARLLVDPQPAPARLAQDPVGGPFGERDLADQPGFHPPGVPNGLGRNLGTERTRVTPQRP